MERRYFFLGGQRVDNLYCLQKRFRDSPGAEELLLSELVEKYAAGVFPAWLLTQFPRGKQEGRFDPILDRQLEPDTDSQPLLELLCELCGLEPGKQRSITILTGLEAQKRAALAMAPWYAADGMEQVEDWSLVALSQKELETMIRQVYEAGGGAIHVCNLGEEYDFRAGRFERIRFTGHGMPVLRLTDPKLTVTAVRDLRETRGLVLENVILRGKCELHWDPEMFPGSVYERG